ncbi:MAG: DUF4382 domain-containing protein [Cellvibrionaceae bacterium]
MFKIINVTFVIAVITLVGCRGVETKNRSGDAQGELTLNITDAPIDDADSVNITITGFKVKEVDNDTLIDIQLDNSETIDLLDYVGTDSEEILDDYSLPVGEYEAITLVLDESLSNISIDGSQYEIPIAVGSEAGLSVDVKFTIEDDSDFDFTLDFDLRKSIVETTTDPLLRTFELQPTLRVVRSDRAAHIVGTVTSNLATQSSCDNNGTSNSEGNVVYVFDGSGADIQDYQGNDGDPITSAIVEKNSNQGYDYTVGFLEPGTYVLAFTCDGTIDDFDSDDFNSMVFSEGDYEIKLTSGAIETVNIEE